ncbi:PREDICTED: syndecan-4-like isoform X2 [Cyprinodon variegatus]|uniref:Syndecan n=1 Tax=Cyprinodon variegatus TaxID=28743 RepID=A0A3Q2DB94_CYPVA|nr:PREDICTED: syndecan-4-like isoform X2 [Cyprinodon variegatus]
MIPPLCLVLMLAASVLSESVRETETWMPIRTTQTVAMTTGDLEASGDASNGSDVGFSDDEDDDEYDEYDASGSGGGEPELTERESRPSVEPDINDNRIPDLHLPVRPTVNEIELVKDKNEIRLLGNEQGPKDENQSNVLMSQATEHSIFNKTEVLAAVIAACAVLLMLAVLLILFLIYRMKKKDEGSYDLGKKPIYKKAPTTEIYA